MSTDDGSGFVLKDSDRTSAVWLRIEAHLQARLTRHRESNDNIRITELATAILRGQISEIKYLLAAGATQD